MRSWWREILLSGLYALSIFCLLPAIPFVGLFFGIILVKEHLIRMTNTLESRGKFYRDRRSRYE